MTNKRDRTDEDEAKLARRRARLMTVKEYAAVARLHPQSVWRRVREQRQVGVHRVGGGIRLEPPDDEDD
jgi:hypothetical protein